MKPFYLVINLKLLKKLDTKFISAPGTSSWCSFTGRTDASLENIKNAIDASCKYQALGSVLTDWGDFGHMQYLPISYPQVVYFGLIAWRNSEGALIDTKEFLNKELFKDENKIMADLLFDLGRYCNYENHFCISNKEKMFIAKDEDGVETPYEMLMVKNVEGKPIIWYTDGTYDSENKKNVYISEYARTQNSFELNVTPIFNSLDFRASFIMQIIYFFIQKNLRKTLS